jgi:hypothetical protein
MARGCLSSTQPRIVCKRKRPELRLELRDARRTALPRSLLIYKIDPFSTRENGTLVRTTDGPMSWLERVGVSVAQPAAHIRKEVTSQSPLLNEGEEAIWRRGGGVTQAGSYGT